MEALCNICNTSSRPLAHAVVLRKHDVVFFRCPRCGFVQTEEPFWLSEAYKRPIAVSDIGLVGRNLLWSHRICALVSLFFNSAGRFLDYGGGYGLLVRLMRDKGYDFYWSDKFCPNLFATGFEAAPQLEPYELLVALEVFEHLPTPLPEASAMLKLSQNLLISTLLIPPNNPRPGEWWYYALDDGQHVSFYTERSLMILAERLGLRLYTNGRDCHLLTPKRLSTALFRAVVSRWVSAAFAWYRYRTSLTTTASRTRMGIE